MAAGGETQHETPGRLPPTALRFPAVARLELDELLDQLVERAGEVRATQGRLRGLLAATRYVTEGLELPELLQRVVDAARALAGARYAALGVVRDGGLVRFVHTGMADHEVATIGDLPRGVGVLGVLIDRPSPLRLDDLSTHAAAVGFPAGHPPMRSFLGVPVRVGDQVYGHLYLAEAERGAFDADDEELVAALAGTAGVAIENALLLENAQRRERWRAASVELVGDLLAGDDAKAALTQLLEIVERVAPADGAALTQVADDEPDLVRIVYAAGEVAGWTGQVAPLPGSITQAAIEAGVAVAVDDPHRDPRTSGVVDRLPDVRAVAAVPLVADAAAPDGERSVLVLTRSVHGGPFGPEETRMLEQFATHAATALALARSRHDREAVRRLADREQLVLDVNHRILQRVQRVALALTGAASTADLDSRDRLLAQVAELDAITRAVRAEVSPG